MQVGHLQPHQRGGRIGHIDREAAAAAGGIVRRGETVGSIVSVAEVGTEVDALLVGTERESLFVPRAVHLAPQVARPRPRRPVVGVGALGHIHVAIAEAGVRVADIVERAQVAAQQR